MKTSAGALWTPPLKAVTLRNLLSFGPDTEPFRLERLNVLIGPNGSGKSNFVEALGLLRSSASDLRPVIGKGGGVAEWIWKGQPNDPASIEAVVKNPHGPHPLRHVLAFRREEQFFRLHDERIQTASPSHRDKFLYRFRAGEPVIAGKIDGRRRHQRETIKADLSILAQRRGPEVFPEITHLAESYEQFRLFRAWAFGGTTIVRAPQRADLPTDRLEEDFSNVGLVLNRLRRETKVKDALLSRLRDLYDGITDVDVRIEGGTVQVFFREGDFPIPATRLSDGSLRYLCLLAILCDPEPPELIGIEEPELGLHPDLLPKVADLLIEASHRTQLIVTTHSDILIDALTETPSAVVVCEKHDGQTTMNRLDPAELAKWLKKYRLGQLWIDGELGGKRW